MTTPEPIALPDRCAVVGGGRMGCGVAHALALAGADVVVVETDADRAAAALSQVQQDLRRSVSRDATLDEASLLARASSAVGLDAAAGSGLVVEAVPEDAALKARVLAQVEARLDPDAVLATNTSSLPIGELAAVLARPHRFLGLHFFNPVPASLLVEVVVGQATDPAVVATATGWVATLRKTAVVVRDAPGFASSRLGVALGLEAIRMVEEGVAAPADIDAAMTLGYKHPVGPLRLTDLVGLDVRLGIARHLEQALGPRFAPPALMVTMVEQGRLGRKSGQGFYDWTD